MTRLLTKPYVGFAAESVISRYFFLYYGCSVIALAHLAAEWFYSGKGSRTNFILIACLTFAGLVGGLGLQKSLHQWHWLMYYGKPAEQASAAKAFALWHGLSQLMNLGVIVCLAVYLWRTSQAPETARFATYRKNQGLTNRLL